MSAQKVAERAYSIREAAELKGVSYDYILAAIKRTEAPFLAAKNVSTGKRKTYRISASALEAYWDSLPDG